jgi:hypothetical protein
MTIAMAVAGVCVFVAAVVTAVARSPVAVAGKVEGERAT